MAIHSLIALARDLDAPLALTPLRHALVSGDNLGDRFEVAVTRAGQPVALDGAGVQAYFIRSADGYTIPLTGSAAGHTAAVTLAEACYETAGRFTLTIKATLGSERHALAVLEGAVLEASTDALIDPAHTIPDVNELLAMVAQLEAATTAAAGARANADAAAAGANDAAAGAKAAAAVANGAAAGANTAALTADAATSKANAAAAEAAKWKSVAGTVTMLGADEAPALTVADTQTGKTLELRIPRGLTGLTPRLRIGSVETVDSYDEAGAEIVGTDEEPLLNLRLPRGLTGSIESLTINGVPVESGQITLTPEIIGARPAAWTPTAPEVGAIPAADRPAILTGARAVNLLDNSDFMNPVNQRGVTSGALPAGYFIDRWRLTAQSTVALSAGGLAVTGGYIEQRFPKGVLDQSKTYTFAMMSGNGLYRNVGPSGSVWISYSNSGYDSISVYLPNIASGVPVQWVALYEGSYAADALPPYVPRGFAAELRACMRHFQRYRGTAANLFLSSGMTGGDGSVCYLPMLLPEPMLPGAPTVGYSNLSGVKLYDGGAANLTALEVYSYDHNAAGVGACTLAARGSFTARSPYLLVIQSGSDLTLSREL